MTTITLEGKEYQLDIEKAKKLNLLKEKDGRVMSWSEFKRKYSNIILTHTSAQLTAQDTYALAAFSRLLKLRRDWIGEWEPKNEAYAIVYWDTIIVDWIDCKEEHRTLSFPTEQMAREFLETFRDLIEEAKILI